MSKIQYEERNYEEKSRLKRESLFHLASGRLGIRGSFEEGVPDGALSIRGAYLNGFCENEAIVYNERLYGFADEKQQIVNLPDVQTIRLFADGQLLACWSGRDLVQTLDMESGVYIRSFTCDLNGGTISVSFTRLVSFSVPDVYAVECKLESKDFSGSIMIESSLNPAVRNFTVANDPRVASGDGKILETVSSCFNGNAMTAISITKNSRRKVAVVSVHDLANMENTEKKSSGELIQTKTIELNRGETYMFHKFSIYREIQDDSELQSVVDAVKSIAENGFHPLRELQQKYMEHFWKNARVTVDGDENLQSQLDFCLYGMLASAGKDGKTNVAAKGLSGEGYEGHYFWDSEIYIFPFFLTTAPQIARALLEYRYLHLEDARKHARGMGHMSGALYPWRTITGRECSSHYPSGSAQYHINGDIAHAFVSYWQVTGDESFLDQTCELLAETARLWIDAGHWYKGSFRINCVTGPDEYTCVVNNNYYTNACAADNLIYAEKLCRNLEKLGRLDALKEKIHLTEEELESFRAAGEGMYFPHDEELQIIAQDDSFLKKKRWDLNSIPKENYPLLMHYHPLIINRYQVLKQADSVLANHIYREEDILTMKRSFEYYEEITTHDSSLSNCIYAIMAARLGDVEQAYTYFTRCVGTDTSDQNGNTRDGLHIANMGGVYRVLTFGFGGIKVTDSGLSLFPLVPAEIKEIRFPVFYQGSRILVTAKNNECTLELLEGEETDLEVFGQTIHLGSEQQTVMRRIRGVVFDLDGVITDTAVFHYKAWKKLADELGIEFNEERNEQFKGVSRAQCLKLLLEWGEKQVNEQTFADLLERKNNMYCEYLDTLTPEQILPGIQDCLTMLKEKGVRRALFSVSKNTDRILHRLNMTDSFDAIVTGNDIAYSKPHYEGYLLAAERIQVDPRLCVMVEDSAAGIHGARLVSMRTIAIMKENVENADLCIPSTEGICEAVKCLL